MFQIPLHLCAANFMLLVSSSRFIWWHCCCIFFFSRHVHTYVHTVDALFSIPIQRSNTQPLKYTITIWWENQNNYACFASVYCTINTVVLSQFTWNSSSGPCISFLCVQMHTIVIINPIQHDCIFFYLTILMAFRKKGCKIAFFRANSAAPCTILNNFNIFYNDSFISMQFAAAVHSMFFPPNIINIFDAKSMASTKNFPNYEFLLSEAVNSKLLIIIGNKSFGWLGIDVPKIWFWWISYYQM